MTPDTRRQAIIDFIRSNERASVDELAATLTISRETIRRDLAVLATRGLVRKVHGGATIPELGTVDRHGEGPFQSRMLENLQEKRAVARRAADLFDAGETLFVDTGTTTVVFGDCLADRIGLTVITNSTAVARAAARGKDSRVYLLGGEYRDAAGETVGALTIQQIGQFHAAHAVLTVGGIHADGMMDFDLQESEVARAMVDHAQSVTVIADSSKYGRIGLFQVCPLKAVDRLVIDRLPKGDLLDLIRAAEIELIVTEPRDGRHDPAVTREPGRPRLGKRRP